MNDLLQSFEGQATASLPKAENDETDVAVFWRPVFGIDREL